MKKFSFIKKGQSGFMSGSVILLVLALAIIMLVTTSCAVPYGGYRGGYGNYGGGYGGGRYAPYSQGGYYGNYGGNNYRGGGYYGGNNYGGGGYYGGNNYGGHHDGGYHGGYGGYHDGGRGGWHR